jgi:hypothetical protein
MSRERDAILTALAYIRWKSFGECRTDGYDIQPPTPKEVVNALESALTAPAPSAEPVGHLHSNGDFCWKRSIAPENWPVSLYEAPPAPSAESVDPMLATPEDKAVYQAIADNYFKTLSLGSDMVNWLLDQCDEYQQRAHKAELEAVRLQAALKKK